MYLLWSQTAKHDIEQIHAYVAAENKAAADTLVTLFRQKTKQLCLIPSMGRRGKVPETREMVAGNYILVYKIQQDYVSVLTIYHSARKWPS